MFSWIVFFLGLLVLLVIVIVVFVILNYKDHTGGESQGTCEMFGTADDVGVTDDFQTVQFDSSIGLQKGSYSVSYNCQFVSNGLQGGTYGSVLTQLLFNGVLVENSKCATFLVRQPDNAVFSHTNKTIVLDVDQKGTLELQFARIAGTTQILFVGKQASITISTLAAGE